jgi:hypothetical protein
MSLLHGTQCCVRVNPFRTPWLPVNLSATIGICFVLPSYPFELPASALHMAFYPRTIGRRVGGRVINVGGQVINVEPQMINVRWSGDQCGSKRTQLISLR